MLKKKLPSISIIIPTYNSSRTLSNCLKSIGSQDYPKYLIELIVVDGGSNDNTIKVAKQSKAKVINVSKDLQNAEYNKGIGVNAAKNEILLLLDHDNVLPHYLWLQKMMEPLLENKKVVGVEPLRFHYSPKMTILDRYFALIGGTDPVAYYLGKNSHLSWAFDEYNLYGKSRDLGKYYLVKFEKNKIPALGGNGAAIRRKLLLKEAKANPESFFHIDVNVDLIRKGFNEYAIIKDSIIHLANNKVIPFLLRRKYFIEKYHFEDMSKRRYSIYEPKKDRLSLFLFILFSITFVKPTFDSIRGFIKIHDIAWFIHPFMCICMVFLYGFPTVKEEIKRVFKK